VCIIVLYSLSHKTFSPPPFLFSPFFCISSFIPPLHHRKIPPPFIFPHRLRLGFPPPLSPRSWYSSVPPPLKLFLHLFSSGNCVPSFSCVFPKRAGHCPFPPPFPIPFPSFKTLYEISTNHSNDTLRWGLPSIGVLAYFCTPPVLGPPLHQVFFFFEIF